MRRALPYVVAIVGMVAMFWLLAQINNGPAVTGPEGSQVVVADVANPATDPPPTTTQTSSSVPESIETTQATEAIEDIWALPEGFRQLLERDAIAPIYDPVYTSAEDSTWPDNALVIGVEINGDARAWPVGYLNRREMVIDEIGGEPVLVSW